MSAFNATVLLNDSLNTLITNLAMDLAIRSVMECSKKYNFDGEEAVRELGLNSSQLQIETTQPEENSGLPPLMSVRRKKSTDTVILKKSKVTTSKPAFPLPYNGVINDDTCLGLKNNHCLYTQCELKRISDSNFCKVCSGQSSKNSNGKPDYGTIWDRAQVGIMEYLDPNGKGPIHYTKLMKKMELTKEAVIQEAERFDITIDPIHFIEPEQTNKAKAVASKKGRPQKTDKVIEVDECNNLFAALTLNSAEQADNKEEPKPEPLKVEKKEKATKIPKDAKLEKAQKAEEAKLEKARKAEEAKAEKARKAEEVKAEKARLKEQGKKCKTTKNIIPVEIPVEILPEIKTQQTTSSSNDESNGLVKFEYDGVVYFKTPDGLLYNEKKDLMGKINSSNDVVLYGGEEDGSDEESEDSYEEEE
jgi:hypothetical protein